MFDDTLIQVHDVGMWRVLFRRGTWLTLAAFDQSTNHLFLRATQTLRAPFIRRFYAPQSTYVLSCAAWAKLTCDRLIVLLSLRRRNDGKYYITRQQDVYPLQEMPGRIIPGLPDVIDIVKLFAGFFCALFAAIFQLLGFWRVTEPRAKLQ